MNKVVELPIAEPMYSTYHFQGSCIAVTTENPSVRNWILNESTLPTCSRSFLSDRTTPDFHIVNSAWWDNPYLERIQYPLRFTGGYINPIIRNLLDQKYYVYFAGVDDYYMKGKSWYKEKHISHDGMICGYNQTDKTYCLYSYDSNWTYRKFWMPQRCFDRGREAIQKAGGYGDLYGIRVKEDQVEFSPETVYQKLIEYLDSSFKVYPIDGEGNAFGIIVQEYLAMYVGKLADGSIPYEQMDRRVFRLIWEHKVIMAERLQKTEDALEMDHNISERYFPLVEEANTMRMLYASHHMKRRDSLLPVIQKKLLHLKGIEEILLTEFVEKLGGVLKK